ncbi:hypothetical protein ACFX12_003908 [Malus domestica]
MGLSKSEGGLGFRSFKEFNLALLAKQSWRIINEPNSLWVRFLKPGTSPTPHSLKLRKGPELRGVGQAFWKAGKSSRSVLIDRF